MTERDAQSGRSPSPPERPGKRSDRDGTLEADLREACASDAFTLAYQPQIDLRTGRVIAFEALVRWTHPVRGNLPPGDFLPLAERVGLLRDIGRWVLAHACMDAATWPNDVHIAVNVTADQLRDPAFPDIVSSALGAVGLPAARLELELIETGEIPLGPDFLDVVNAVAALGVAFVVDDFDVGQSTLARLITFPAKKLKIDRSIIAELPEEKAHHDVALHVVRSIVELCARIGLICVAEGVETEEQLEKLIQLACPAVQGYLLGPPHRLASVPRSEQNALALGLMERDDRVRQLPAVMPFSFRDVIDRANDIVIITTAELDPPGPIIVYVNEAFTRLTGYSAVEAIGRSPRMLQGPGTNRAALHNISVALRAGKVVREKVLNFAKSGAPYWLDIRIGPLRDARGAITHFAAIQRDITLDKRRLDELEYLADRDTLTGIPNRRAFMRALKCESEAPRTHAYDRSEVRNLCLVLLDIDHFKRVNDTYGHPVGDAILCGLADYLSENIRRADNTGRIGGEEFAICMPGIELDEAKSFAERVRVAVKSLPFDTPTGPKFITLSLGVACHRPGENIAQLIQRADNALYVAKRQGRDRVELWSDLGDVAESIT